MRTVGQVQFHRLNAEDGLLLCMRIRTGIYDDNLDQAAFYANSFFNEDGAEEPFLWQRYLHLEPLIPPQGALADPWWTTIDVRVKRRIPRGQALFFSLQANVLPTGGNGEVYVVPFLRTWCRVA